MPSSDALGNTTHLSVLLPHEADIIRYMALYFGVDESV